ncbi:hypothetical protein KIPE111705_22425 [Kibdelosporangium persicum]|uniref:Uncharacterized protein n=1 Tax=Kibdelosporangium persicum TaxID=2698649 RepID=A0ABX2FED2_9PSEU|nr:hypothetical protein [Kibdelosporangium persicum]NRN69588.1 hypothetical protein [Kibdelosporangium persicum]
MTNNPVINSPYTRFSGDALHGWQPIVTPAWVQLDAIYVRSADVPVHTVADGLDMTGRVHGHVSGWWRTVKGDWLGVVNYAIPFADGRQQKLELRDQLIPGYALSKRETA